MSENIRRSEGSIVERLKLYVENMSLVGEASIFDEVLIDDAIVWIVFLEAQLAVSAPDIDLPSWASQGVQL